MHLCTLSKKNMVKTFSKIGVFFSVFIFLPFLVSAATLSVTPSSGTFEVGERVIVKVIVSSNDVQFNAVSGNITFPSSIFEIESVSKTNSILNFWATEPVFSKNLNTVRFEGISLGGFQGFTGTAVTIALRAVKAGSGQVSFTSGQVLANDGQGTDITGDLIGASFTVKEASIKKSPTKTKEPVLDRGASQPSPSLNAPEIVLGTKYQTQAILGTSDYPRTQALITFTSEDGTKIFILANAGDDGSFNAVIPKSLKSGTYSVKAVVIKEDKTNSNESNIIIIKIGSIFSDVGWQIWFFMLLLVIAILYLLMRLYFHFGKNKNTKKYDDLHKAEDIVHKSFDVLRDDIRDYDSEKSTKLDRKHLDTIKKDINHAEKVIKQEIDDIE